MRDQHVLRVLVTGAHGFIGHNLSTRLREAPGYLVTSFVRGDDPRRLPTLIAQADAVVHLAGENRPDTEDAFARINASLTEEVCSAVAEEFRSTGRHISVLLASSTQAERDNAYGRSKLAAEAAVIALNRRTGSPVTIFRLPGVFGKWSRPNYNSVVATFCYNIARGLPIRIDDPSHCIRLVYIDDVVDAITASLEHPASGVVSGVVGPEYTITLAELADQIKAFEDGRNSLQVEQVGVGLTRALYATYVSMLPTERFAYQIPQHRDPRGVFVEMLKTPGSGQFSYLTAPPGVTRGGHHHHTKVEKFLVIHGHALFRFRHLLTNEYLEIETVGERSQIVETIPGWSHDITNVGQSEMIVLLWANEVFDHARPDTISSRV